MAEWHEGMKTEPATNICTMKQASLDDVGIQVVSRNKLLVL